MNAPTIPRLAALRPDERWRVGERGARLSAVAVAILVGSLALHVALLASTMIGAQAKVVAPKEIPIEIVQEMPKPAAKPEALKPEAPKPAAMEPAAMKPVAPVPPAPEKPAAAKPAPAQPPAPQPTAAKPTAPPQPPPLRAARAEPDHAQIEDLKRELAELKAEQAMLKADEGGVGPLRDSIRAIALPSGGNGDDADAVSYQSLVFSALARAKEGVVSKAAGTVGIRFTLDEEGRLLDVAVAVPSGSAGLDAEAVAIVRRAAFPKPPAGAERVFSANVSSAMVAR